MMDNTPNSSHPLEPAQDEMPSKPVHQVTLDRRKFLKLTGSGLIVAFVLQDIFSFAGDTIPSGSWSVPVNQVGAWLHVGEDGMVTVYTGKVEVGQNIRTSLSQIVAEELKV